MSLLPELQRKGIHLLTSLIPLTYAVQGSRKLAIVVLAIFSAVMLIVESFRHSDGWVGQTFRRLFGSILREKESHSDLARAKWLGATPYCLASLFAILVFPKPVAVLALLYLAYGDTAASLVGKTWGRTRIGEKSLEGTAAFAGVTSLVAIGAHGFSPEYPLMAGLAGAVAAALAELLLPRLDDNLTVPLAAGIAMIAIQSLSGS